MKKTHLLWAATAAAALALAGCGGSGGDTPNTEDKGELVTVKVGASPTPHGEILRFVAENLAAEAGLKLEIVEFNDYVQPNKALHDGSLDANYFQHLPYLEAQMAEFNYDFYAFEGIHIEPLGIYSDEWEDFTVVPPGATIGVSNDPSNQARGLRLLETAGLFTLKDTSPNDPTIDDLADNPYNVVLTQLDAQLLPKSMPDFDYVVINGNFAIDAGLSPSTDSMFLEDGQGNPYANMLVVRAADKARPELDKLDQLLHSQDVRAFIEENWSDGAVIPAF